MRENEASLSFERDMAAAREAQAVWGETPYRERAGRIREALRYLGRRIDQVVETIHRENGKLELDALAAEVLPALMAGGYYIRKGKNFLAPRPIRGGNPLMFNKRSRLIYRPYGVIGIISPWNYPFAIPFSEAVMALLAGNAVFLKVASDTLAVGRLLKELFSPLPPHVFNYFEMPGREAGPALIKAGVDKLCFTGSTAVGRELMSLAAPRLLPLVLELGGADAAIVREDADLDRAVAGIVWAGFSNAGQSCGGVQRVLVHQAVYRPFMEKLCARVCSLKSGRGPDADLGPMTTLRQRDAVRGQVESCLAMGAEIAAQSPPPDELASGGSVSPEAAGLWFPATVLRGVKETMPVMREEIFGPVLAAFPVADDAGALRVANASPYGLTASVWSRNRRAAGELARQINAGVVMINDHLMSHGLAETPWGGFGDSGFGRTHGETGFREMLKATVIVDDILPGVRRNLWWQPYSARVYRGIRAIAELLGGASLAKRLGALPGVLRIFFRYWEK